MTRALLAAGWLWVLASPAAADDLPEPPEECPPGSTPHTEHAGQWCAATTCESDVDCTATSQRARHGVYASENERHVCREVSLCVRHETYQLGGLRPEPATGERDVAVGPCVEARCPGGGTCTTMRRCVPEGTPDVRSGEAPETSATAPSEGEEPGTSSATQREDSSGGCAVSDAPSGAALPWLLALGWVLRRRRA